MNQPHSWICINPCDNRTASAEFIKLWSGSHNQYNQYIEEQSKYPK